MTITPYAPDRKKMVEEIANFLGASAEYQHAPSFAYKIGELTVERDGSIHTENEELLGKIKILLIAQGYLDDDAPEAVDAPEQIQEPAREEEPIDIAIGVPLMEMKPDALRNLVFILYSKQTLLNHSTGNTTLRISDLVIERLKGELPATELAFAELMKEFASSGEMEGLDFEADKLTISYGPLGTPEKFAAFMYLTAKMTEAAKAAKRVFPDHAQPESEKYVMRSWLVRMGMGGPEFKSIRNHLLKKLSGHTAFRNAEEARKHSEKYAAKRKATREAAATNEQN